MASSDLTSGADSVRSYTPEENRQLTENLLVLVREVHARRLVELPPSIDLLRWLHAQLFEGVRSHAGRIRGPGFGQEYLAFGPNRSSHRDNVQRELEEVFRSVLRELAELRANPTRADYERAGIWLGVRVHAEIIRIHPFEDGNGRSSRLMMSHVLVALDLLPIPIEACKDEYNKALNVYFARSDGAPLLDLFLRLYPIGAASV